MRGGEGVEGRFVQSKQEEGQDAFACTGMETR
jgi:hypothetical protein